MSTQVKTISNGRLQLAVAAELGGHITRFSLDGVNALLEEGPEVGSTFWPAPQSLWNWPPPVILDKGHYQIRDINGDLQLISPVCPETGLQFYKTMRLHVDRLALEYCIANRNSAAVQCAPWEVTRLAGGITFYRSPQLPLLRSSGATHYAGGCVWHEYQPHRQTAHEKIFGNGSHGWVANANGGLLLVKQFAPLSPMSVAPEEAEIEIYAHAAAGVSYIEMEQQGPYKVIAPGERIRWSVDWYLAALPANMLPVVGDARLVAQVQDLLAGAAVLP